MRDCGFIYLYDISFTYIGHLTPLLHQNFKINVLWVFIFIKCLTLSFLSKWDFLLILNYSETHRFISCYKIKFSKFISLTYFIRISAHGIRIWFNYGHWTVMCSLFSALQCERWHACTISCLSLLTRLQDSWNSFFSVVLFCHFSTWVNKFLFCLPSFNDHSQKGICPFETHFKKFHHHFLLIIITTERARCVTDISVDATTLAMKWKLHIYRICKMSWIQPNFFCAMIKYTKQNVYHHHYQPFWIFKY